MLSFKILLWEHSKIHKGTGFLKMCETESQSVTEAAAVAYGTLSTGPLTCRFSLGEVWMGKKGKTKGAIKDW